MSFTVVPPQLQDREVFWFSELLSGDKFTLDQVVGADSELNSENGDLIFRYKAAEDFRSYQIVLGNQERRIVNGLGVHVELGGWEDISYIAVGFRDGKKYHHVKAANPRQGKYFGFCVGFNDLAWGWSNSWDMPESRKLDELRFYIKGKPGNGAYCKLNKAWIWQESEASEYIWREHGRASEQMLSVLNAYQQDYYPNFSKQAQEYLSAGTCPLAGDTQLQWPVNKRLPPEIGSTGTWQYSWHALHPATFLMLNAQQKQCMPSLMAARDFVVQWLADSFDRPDINKKYAWYDHGVAERVLALLMLHILGQKHQFDVRFMSRLAYAIYRHAQLLASEVFYACHQPIRYHNHAWFQDLALMAVAAAFPQWYSSKPWGQLALERIQDQFNKLIIEELECAVFTENSFGYHLGIERLVSSIEHFSKMLDMPNSIAITKQKLSAFSVLLLYPGAMHGPGLGDTFRQPNPEKRENKIQVEQWSPVRCYLPKSGYFIAKGGRAEHAPWLLALLATNLNATHKHEDDLSLIFWLDGIEWLVDPSFYSHEYEDDLTRFLRSARAHNMLCIPGEPYDYQPSAGRVELNEIKASEQHSIIQGINRSCTNHVIYRRLELVENESGQPRMDVTDYFEPLKTVEKHVDGVLSFHFGDGVTIQPCAAEQGHAYRLSHPASIFTLMLQIQAGKDTTPEIRNAWSGLGFLEKVVTEQLVLPLPANTECTWSLYVE